MSTENGDASEQKIRRLIARLEGGVCIAAGIVGYFLIWDDVFPGTSFKGWWLCVLLVVVGLGFILFPNARWVQKSVEEYFGDSGEDS